MKVKKQSFRAKYMRLAYQVWIKFTPKFRKENQIKSWRDAIWYAMNYVRTKPQYN